MQRLIIFAAKLSGGPWHSHTHFRAAGVSVICGAVCHFYAKRVKNSCCRAPAMMRWHDKKCTRRRFFACTRRWANRVRVTAHGGSEDLRQRIEPCASTLVAGRAPPISGRSRLSPLRRPPLLPALSAQRCTSLDEFFAHQMRWACMPGERVHPLTLPCWEADEPFSYFSSVVIFNIRLRRICFEQNNACFSLVYIIYIYLI